MEGPATAAPLSRAGWRHAPWLFAPVFAPFFTYWAACIWLSGRLERARRRAGDPRPVPSLFDPLTSHRWGGIILFEDARPYRPPVRTAFLTARAALALLPLGVLATVVLANSWNGG